MLSKLRLVAVVLHLFRAFLVVCAAGRVSSPPGTDWLSIYVGCKMQMLRTVPLYFLKYKLRFPVLYAHSYIFEIGLKFY